MPNVSLYIDEDLYLPLAIEAQRRHTDLYRYLKEILRQACQDARESPPPRAGWSLVDGSRERPRREPRRAPRQRTT